MEHDSDTIAALATAPGRGGIGIVRLSGPQTREIVTAVAGVCPSPRVAHFGRFLDADGNALDEGIVLFFPGPHSYTGEDVVELQGHGGPVVMDALLARLFSLGARQARAGEFTERAFLNDKMDLAQAEAVADLIDSASTEAAKAALRSLEGEFSARVHALTEALIELRVFVEAAIDFPEEEIDFLTDGDVVTRVADWLAECRALREQARQGRLLRDGMTVVLAGRPNAGKSSLLNRLAGHEAAIVAAIPGTTRDLLREQIDIDGMPLHVIDTAGLRASEDEVEREGVRRAEAAMSAADRVLLVVDASQPAGIDPELPEGVPVTRLENKIDLLRVPAGWQPDASALRLSATTGEGLELLRAHLRECMGFQTVDAGTISARRRHLQALDAAAEQAESGLCRLRETRAGELLAEDLRYAQRALGEITGEFSSDDLLGEVFSSFCIGK